MKKRSLIYFFAISIAISYFFRSWFLNKEIIGGDWPYIFEETLENYSFYFSSWNPFQGNGFGGLNPFHSLGIFHGFTVFLSQAFHASWPFAYKFSWFGLFIGLSVFSSMYLLKSVLPQTKFWQRIFASIVFSTNTYILMVVSGGQMGVALSYAIAPLVLARFIKVVHNSSFIIHHSVLAGLVLAIQVMFDPRIAYLTMIAVAIYLALNIRRRSLNIFFLLLYFVVIPVGIAILLHGAWILSVLFLQSNPDPQGLTSVAGFRFFSFASFSQSISLLHPNWPENIFGKTYFMKAEFMLLPILVYTSLLFIKNPKSDPSTSLRASIRNPKQIQNSKIIFFAVLGIIGAFLAKGVNPPFGEINTFLFEHVPGMNMFRDPTKFYLLVALSYSILIPFVLLEISNRVSRIKYKVLILTAFLAFWVISIRPAIFGQLGGTFKEREVPLEYVKLKDFLHGQSDFFRILWIPRQHRFTYYSLNHLPVEAEPFFKKAKIIDIMRELRKPGTEEYLSELGIKYIIVPDDPNGEIFVKDRKYDETTYLNAIEQLEDIPWLARSRQFEKVAVFETKTSPKDRFRLEEKGKVTYSTRNIVHYNINVEVDSSQRLILSENFHPKWQLVLNDKVVHSQKTDKGLNSFLLSKGNYKGTIEFSGDKYYVYGKIISLSTMVLIAIFLFAMRKKKVYNT